MAEFKIGDVVRLKSGGPSMTVAAVGVGIMGDEIYCAWFEGKKKHAESFPPGALEAVGPSPLRRTLVVTKKGL